ncbi:unnamed protein product [Aphanomyces euteiches]|uniref:AGC protein kinase n=1 Tax=Aphanomyces euteiches TaxID=100861 RepID=A0A6G0XU68_9STRA|nr:hypothetical protein Ae201684_001621 [Aphanomyces euteiches]KAH9075030.1 hypothetical protein Ae201684P_003715 [Aphanomyces euteiches]KAH9137456.1 hypothetical protein AeRB84_017847 [Aphanomyces euteiches]
MSSAESSAVTVDATTELAAIAEALRSHVDIKDRKGGFLKTHVHCFVGSEAVDYLVEASYASTRPEAVALGQRLLRHRFFHDVSNPDSPFQDGGNFYRFLEDEVDTKRKQQLRALSGPTAGSSRPPPAPLGADGRAVSEDRAKGSLNRHLSRNDSCAAPPSGRTRSLIERQRAARLRKKGFCPIESLLTTGPTSAFEFSDTCSFYFAPHTCHNSIALTVPIVNAMKKAFSSHNMHAREAAVHGLRKQVLKAADSDDKNWMYLKNIQGHHGNDVRVFYRNAAGGFHTVLTVGPVHVAPATFVSHFLDNNERKKMDHLYETGQTVEDLLMAHNREMHVKSNIHAHFSKAHTPWVGSTQEMPADLNWAVKPSEGIADMYPEEEAAHHAQTHTDHVNGGVQRILYRTMASPTSVLSARDFVTFQDCFSMNNGAHCVYEISVEHKDIPAKMKNYTRGEVLCLAHIAEPIPGNPNASMLTVVTQVGFKGHMPKFVAQLIFDQLIARSFDSHTCLPTEDTSNVMEKKLKDVPYDRSITEDEQNDDKVGLGDFELLAVLGRGGFAKVMQVRHRQTQKVHAMKILKKEELVHDIQIERTHTERSILAAVEHPFIVSLSYAFQDTKRLFMVMDFVQGGDMYAHLRKYGAISPSRARLYIAEIALAVSHLHALDIVYRDLKPENILIDADGHIKITDFGLSHFFDPPEYDEDSDVQRASTCSGSGSRANSLCQVTHSFCGTEAYMAPEMLLHVGHGKPIDWWCLGIVACEMLTGVHPFRGESQMRLLSNVVNSDPFLPPSLSPEAASLIQGFLCKQSKLRLGSVGRKFEDIKAHPFFADLDWDKVAAKGYPMEFIPHIANDYDVSNFGIQFTSEKFSGANSSDCSTTDGSSSGHEHHQNSNASLSQASTDSQYRFSGFSFVAPQSFNEAGF